jgi:DNA repair protein RadD
MITLRPQQVAGADAIEDGYRAGLMRPLADMCVGSGKSLTMAELARRAWKQRGERTIILAHRQELVKQNAAACVSLGLECGINATKLGERTWRAPVISAMIQSVYGSAQNFGPVQNILTDECHLIPHAQSGMFREFHRAFPHARAPGFSGTVFRLQGGSLVEGEGAPFERVVFTYSIVDGIRDGYLVPAFSAQATDKIDVSKLRKQNGEFTGTSQDNQMLALMDSHIAQMKVGGADRHAWLIFEASQKAAKAMTERLNAWGIPAECVIDKTPNREGIIEAFNQGRLRALVCVESLTTGFDSQRIDLVCFRRRTASLGLYIQMAGRGLRTIGGNIQASILAGKADCLFFDFAGLIDEHGPLDFIRPKESKLRFVTCEGCSARVPSAAMRCWSCDAPMMKNCPRCLKEVERGTLDCPHCNHDMRQEGGGGERKQVLLETPTGAALISSFAPRVERAGGWIPIRKVWSTESGDVIIDTADRWLIAPSGVKAQASLARWVRFEGEKLGALLVPNGAVRTSAMQVMPDGQILVIPMPAQVAA